MKVIIRKPRPLGPQQQRVVSAGRVLVTLQPGLLPQYSLPDGTEVAAYTVDGLRRRGLLIVGDPGLMPGAAPQSYVVRA